MRRLIPVSVLTASVFAVGVGTVRPAVGAGVLPQGTPADQAGSVGVRLVDIPADLADDPRARQYVVDNLAPGTTVHRRIEVTNRTASPLRVSVYPDAADISHGAFVGAAGKTVSELTSWTTLEKDDIDIPSGGSVRDTVTIAVPKDAPPGERYGVIWAQVGDEHRSGVALVNRTGIRVYLSVNGDNPPAAKFSIDSMTAQRDATGRAIVLAQVHNTGGRALDLTGTLKLSQVKGRLNAGPYAVDLGTSLAPGQSEPVEAVVTDPVEDGPWNATFELKSGLLDETYHAVITFPHASGAGPAVKAQLDTTSTRLPRLTVALIGLAGLLTAVLVAFVARARRLRRRAARWPERRR
ncbi:peptidase [Streptomyces sp. CBMA123]|uniref:peptidase n=1 Tax=Streptomyces sp. CBMA123 TaxID=1896313 RepID=UPI0016620ABD|nr:peptidase [Streptomyces sp. CBMA123]MBD0691072.1 hypothetical protein [Streptomyces sp. CBMA123]